MNVKIIVFILRFFVRNDNVIIRNNKGLELEFLCYGL